MARTPTHKLPSDWHFAKNQRNIDKILTPYAAYIIAVSTWVECLRSACFFAAKSENSTDWRTLRHWRSARVSGTCTRRSSSWDKRCSRAYRGDNLCSSTLRSRAFLLSRYLRKIFFQRSCSPKRKSEKGSLVVPKAWGPPKREITNLSIGLLAFTRKVGNSVSGIF